jgi:hypothetical protein
MNNATMSSISVNSVGMNNAPKPFGGIDFTVKKFSITVTNFTHYYPSLTNWHNQCSGITMMYGGIKFTPHVWKGQHTASTK